MQAQRDLPDGADVLRHVLADLAVAARGGLHQHAVLVAQVDAPGRRTSARHVVDRRRVLGQAQLARARGHRRRWRRLASMSVSVRIDSIGTLWRTLAKPSSTLPPTRCVGESGVRSSGCAASSACSSLEQPVVLGVRAARARRARSSGARGGAAARAARRRVRWHLRRRHGGHRRRQRSAEQAPRQRPSRPPGRARPACRRAARGRRRWRPAPRRAAAGRCRR